MTIIIGVATVDTLLQQSVLAFDWFGAYYHINLGKLYIHHLLGIQITKGNKIFAHTIPNSNNV